LENLLINAYHATEEGYILVTCEDISHEGQITSGFDATTPTVRIRIKDTGEGMPGAFCESGEIFEPFRKVDQYSVSDVRTELLIY
jgi:signal transduction histidine kinase